MQISLISEIFLAECMEEHKDSLSLSLSFNLVKKGSHGMLILLKSGYGFVLHLFN